MRTDLHTHTLLSDGALLPIEMARRARIVGYDVIAFTDHVSYSTIDRVVEETRGDCEVVEEWGMEAILGVEITHVPAGKIDALISKARRLGVELILVHGETIVEPVDPRTNDVSLRNPDVDILAHPGVITEEDAQLAKDNDIALEITSKRGHSLCNGVVARMASTVGAELVVNTDAHLPSELMDEGQAIRVALGAGLEQSEAERAVREVPEEIVRRIRGR